MVISRNHKDELSLYDIVHEINSIKIILFRREMGNFCLIPLRFLIWKFWFGNANQTLSDKSWKGSHKENRNSFMMDRDKYEKKCIKKFK